MFGDLKEKSPPLTAAAALYDWSVASSRDPALYRDMGAPDTVEGRFELLTAHIILLVDRLRGVRAGMAQVRQSLFDLYLSNLDGALREMGVGDLAMGKRMKSLGEAFYGRARAYEAAFDELPRPQALERLIARTVLEGADKAAPGRLAAYVACCRQSLADCDDQALIQGRAPRPTSSRLEEGSSR